MSQTLQNHTTPNDSPKMGGVNTLKLVAFAHCFKPFAHLVSVSQALFYVQCTHINIYIYTFIINSIFYMIYIYIWNIYICIIYISNYLYSIFQFILPDISIAFPSSTSTSQGLGVSTSGVWASGATPGSAHGDWNGPGGLPAAPPGSQGGAEKNAASAMEKVGKTWRKWGVNRTKIEVSPVLRDIFLGDSSWDMWGQHAWYLGASSKAMNLSF